MDRLIPATGWRFSLALLLIRIAVAATFFAHGAPKLAHPASWMGPTGPLAGTPSWLQLVVTIGENVGCWCILVGFLTPLFAFLQACDMAVVLFIVKMGHGLAFSGHDGRNYEVEAHTLAAVLALLLCGPGTFSIDALLKRRLTARRP